MVICACVENGQELLDLAKVVEALRSAEVPVRVKLISLEKVYQDRNLTWVRRNLPLWEEVLIVSIPFSKKPFAYYPLLLKAWAVLSARRKILSFCQESDLILVGIQSVFQRMLYASHSRHTPFVSMHRALLFNVEAKFNRARDLRFRLLYPLIRKSPMQFMFPTTPGVGYTDYYFEIGQVNKEYLVEQGVDPERIFITGSPTYDWFYTESGKLKIGGDGSKPSFEPRRPVRLCYITGAYEWVGDNVGEKFQKQKIAELIDFTRLRADVSMTIRVHPRERLEKYKLLVKTCPHVSLEQYNPRRSIFEDLDKYDVVIGTISQVLYDSVLMGKLVIFYSLPGEIQRYDKFFQRTGIQPVQSFEEVVDLIEGILANGTTRKLKEYREAQSEAVKKIIHLPPVKPSELIATHLRRLVKW